MTLVGKAILESAAILQARGIDLDLDTIAAQLIAEVDDEVRAVAPWCPGARELLHELYDAGVPMALVTSSYESSVAALLTHLPSDIFRVTVTGDTVTNSKPHPEPYLTALHQLGVAAGDAVAVEDSASGTGSTFAAGVPTIVVGPQEPMPGQVRIPSLAGVRAADLVAHFG